MINTRSTRLSCISILILSTNLFTASEKCESDGLYIIRSRGTNGLVLDATDADQIRVQHFSGSDVQLWKFQPADKPGLYFIINEHHNKVLDFDVRGDGLDKVFVVVKELQKTLQQKWNFDTQGRIVNAANERNVDITGANFTAGNHLLVIPDNGCICQRFLLQKKT